MASESIGTARVDIIVDTDQFDVAINSAKRSVADMSQAAQQQYAALSAAERRRVDSLRKQADTLGFTRQQQIAYNAALKTEGPLLDEITRRLRATQAAATGAGIEFNKYGVSAKQNAAALRQVPAQLTDIIVGLQGGQAPLTVLLQQGGQLRDVFGGAVPALRAIGGAALGLVNPFTLAAGAIAAVVLAYEQAGDQQRAFENALTLTGGYAGMTADELGRLSRELDAIGGTTTREAAAALAQIAGTGQFTASQLELVTTAALQMQAATGRAIEETVAEFTKLSKDPVDAILALNEQYHFLTQAQLDNIVSLKEQGREQDAVNAAFRAHADQIAQRAPVVAENLGLISGAFASMKTGAAEAWDEVVTGIQRADREAKEGLQSLGRLMSLFQGGGPAAMLGLGGATNAGGAPSPRARANTSVDSAAAAKALKDRKDAEEEFARLALSNLSKREKLEREIREIRELGVKAGRTEAEIEGQIANARARFAESLPKGRKEREKADPTEALLNRLRQQIALNQEQAQSEDALTASERLRVQIVTELERLGTQATATRRAEIDTLLEQVAASDRAAVAFKAEAEAREDLARLSAVLAAEEESQRRAIQADLMGIGRGGDAVEMLRRQIDIQRALADGLDDIKRDAAGKTAEALRAEETALRASIDRRLETERWYWQQRAEMQADWTNGAVAAWEDYGAASADIASQTYDAFSATFTGLEDALTQFFRTGEASFSDFLGGIADEIAKFMAKQAVAELLASFGGGAIGQMFGPTITGFAGGGYTGPGGVNQPKGIVHAGEVVWSQRDVARAGGVGAVEAMRVGGLRGYATGGVVGGGGTTIVNFEVINNTGEEVRRERTTTPDGQMMERIIIGAVKKGYGQGAFDSEMSQFGMQRRGVTSG